jgi:hypothetical protein
LLRELDVFDGHIVSKSLPLIEIHGKEEYKLEDIV